MAENYSRSISTLPIDDLTLYDRRPKPPKKNKRACVVPKCMRIVSKALAVITLTVLTVLALEMLQLSPLDRKFRDGRICLPCGLVNVSSGRWREGRYNGEILCCVTDTEQIPAPVASPLITDPRGENRARLGAQLHLNTTALRGNPPRLSWSADTADVCYLNGLIHTDHVYNHTTYDCLEVPVEQNYLITAQLVFTNLHPGGFGPETYREAFNTYYTVIRFSSSGRVDTIGKVYFAMTSRAGNDRRHRSSIIKEPGLYTRSLHLKQSDKICLTAENLCLIYADPIGNYFGIFEL